MKSIKSIKSIKSLNVHHIIQTTRGVYALYIFWALMVLGISLAVQVLLWIFTGDVYLSGREPGALVRGPGQIFMLIIGIVTGIYAISFFIRQGVTRLNFLWGTILAACAIALSLQILGIILHLISLGLGQVFSLHFADPSAEIGALSSLGVQTLANILVFLVFFAMGWIIGLSFYRFRLIAGLASILAGLFLMSTISSLWGQGFEFVIPGLRLPRIQNPGVFTAFGITLVSLVGQFGILYGLIRKMPVKVQ